MLTVRDRPLFVVPSIRVPPITAVVAVLVSARIALIADSRSRPQRNELGDGNVVDVHTAGLSSFQYPSEMTSTPTSVTLMAV